jgi:hypothetical protein
MDVSDCGTAVSTGAALPRGIGWLSTTDSCSDEDSMTITQFAKFLYLWRQSADGQCCAGNRVTRADCTASCARQQKGRLGLEPTPSETMMRMMTTGTLRRAELGRPINITLNASTGPNADEYSALPHSGGIDTDDVSLVRKKGAHTLKTL